MTPIQDDVRNPDLVNHLLTVSRPTTGPERSFSFNGPEVLNVAADAIFTVVVISAPLMIVGTIVGVAVSLFQAFTQIQEQTLVQTPKIVASFITVVFALPFMAEESHRQFLRIIAAIAAPTNP